MPAAFYIMQDYGEEAETMPSIHYQYTVDGRLTPDELDGILAKYM